jgi:small nuclear ribonucleoprotein (snRNP)-like protein
MPKHVRAADQSLACFVQALEGLAIVAELHNDTIVRGRLESADDGMNLTLVNATVQPLQGSSQSMHFLFVKGANVRLLL